MTEILKEEKILRKAFGLMYLVPSCDDVEFITERDRLRKMGIKMPIMQGRAFEVKYEKYLVDVRTLDGFVLNQAV